MCGECKSQRCYGNCHPLLRLLFSEKFLCEHEAGASAFLQGVGMQRALYEL